MKASKASSELTSQLESSWRSVDTLVREIDRKYAHIKLLISHKQIPIMTTDAPLLEMSALLSFFRQIDCLQTAIAARRRKQRTRNVTR